MPNYKDLKFEHVAMLKYAGLEANRKIKDRDYIVKDGKVILVDRNTHYLRHGARWNDFIHEMVEVKERVKVEKPSIMHSMVTQNGFFHLYEKIGGLTGTLGDARDEFLVRNEYHLNTFRVPRNIESRRIFTYQDPPEDTATLYKSVAEDVEKNLKERRPVLVIFDSIDHVNKFSTAYYPRALTIKGIEPVRDRYAVDLAGESANVTIATHAAGRGVDIKVSEEKITKGGLHVIVANPPKNVRMLEQAIGRAGRQGQPGSAKVYMNLQRSKFRSTPDFQPKYTYLFNIQNKFSTYLKSKYTWVYQPPRIYNLGEMKVPFQASPEEVLKIAADKIAKAVKSPKQALTAKDLEILNNYMFDMILSAWGVFFNELEKNLENRLTEAEYEQAYQLFTKELETWIPANSSNILSNYEHIKRRVTQYPPDLLDTLELASTKAMHSIAQLLDQTLPESVKEALKTRIGQGITKSAGGIAEISAGVLLVMGSGGLLSVGGAASATFGANNLIDGMQDLWHGARGEDTASINLLQEATRHKVDHTLDLTNIIADVFTAGASTAKCVNKLTGRQSVVAKSSNQSKYRHKLDSQISIDRGKGKTKYIEGTGNSFSRSIQSTKEIDTSAFNNLKNKGVIDVGRSGSNRPFAGTPNSYYKTKNGNIVVYDNKGKLMYDISSNRVKIFDINISPQGKEFFNPRKLDGTVPDEILKLLK